MIATTRYCNATETSCAAAWARAGGREVSVDGDGCFVAFADTRAAVAACGGRKSSWERSRGPLTVP